MQPEDTNSMVDDTEAVSRAKHKGRAYQCIPCYHKEGKETIDVKGRIEEHILKNHVSLDEVPYYCRLCLFRCQRHDQLLQHVTSYARHREMANKRKVTDHSQFLVTSPNPHQFTEMDYCKLSAEASLLYFMRHQTTQRCSPVAAAVQRLESGQLLEDITKSTMEAGYITCTAPPVFSPPPVAIPTSVEDAAKQIQGSELPATFVQSLLSLLAGTSPLQTIPSLVASQSNEASHDADETREDTVNSLLAVPRYVPTPKVLLRQGENDDSSTEVCPNTEQYDPEQPTSASEASWQPLDIGLTSLDCDQPLDLSVKPPTSVKLDPPSHPEGQPENPTASSKDTRLIALTSDPHVANSTTKVQQHHDRLPEEAGSVEDGQMTPDGHHEAKDSEEEDPTPNKELEEDILSQLLAPEPMELSSSNKRPSSDSDVPQAKRHKDDPEEPTIDISLVAINSLVSVLQDLRESERQKIRSDEKVAMALMENTAMIQKLTSVVQRLEETIKTSEREERKREDRRQELERARQTERKREKEEDRKWEQKRWEIDRIARGERRRAEERQSGTSSRPSLSSVLAEKDKENNTRKSKRD